jgi:putative SOS response-associated peptidase YedK
MHWVETVDTASSFREAFKKQRCLIPADGFYEWKKVVGGKIPYSIGMKDDSPFVLPVFGNQAGKEVLVPYPAEAMRAWPISPSVNSPKNDDPKSHRIGEVSDIIETAL